MLSMTQSWFSIGIGPRLRDDKGARGGFGGRTGYQYSYDALYVCVKHCLLGSQYKRAQGAPGVVVVSGLWSCGFSVGSYAKSRNFELV